ncbi:hypothetical protein NKH77_40715 [Streptomyces sp. M19]
MRAAGPGAGRRHRRTGGALPDRALTGRATGVLTTTGTDADPGDNTARTTLRILQPRIVAVPPIGKPGFVTSVRGKDFRPGRRCGSPGGRASPRRRRRPCRSRTARSSASC